MSKVNRIELTNLQPENGLIVILYRFHPGWETFPNAKIEHYPVPEDPVGFIAIRNPEKNITLRYDPWKSLTAEWPKIEFAKIEQK